jgi:hypothetical protein
MEADDGRFTHLEGRMLKAEERINDHDVALRGSLDGKQLGLVALVNQLLEQSKSNGAHLEGLRLDRAKIFGIIAGVTTLLGLVYKLFLK